MSSPVPHSLIDETKTHTHEVLDDISSCLPLCYNMYLVWRKSPPGQGEKAMHCLHASPGGVPAICATYLGVRLGSPHSDIQRRFAGVGPLRLVIWPWCHGQVTRVSHRASVGLARCNFHRFGTAGMAQWHWCSFPHHVSLSASQIYTLGIFVQQPERHSCYNYRLFVLFTSSAFPW